MAATVEGTFKILDKASGPIKRIGAAALAADKAIQKLGKELDKLDRTVASIKKVEKSQKDLSDQSVKTAAKVDVSQKKMAKSIESSTSKGTISLDKLLIKLREVEAQRATAQVDVDIAMAEAKIRLIKQQINSISTERARTELGDLGLSAGAAASQLGEAGLGGAASSGIGAMGKLGIAAAVLAPIILTLAGAVGALAGSLVGAVGGIGVIGGGLIGAMVAGLLSVVAVAKPAMAGMKDYSKAVENLNKAQAANDPTKIKEAQKQIDLLTKKYPGIDKVSKGFQELGKRWAKLSAPGQRQFFGLLGDAIDGINKKLPILARETNKNVGAARKAIGTFFRTLNEDGSLDKFIAKISSTFRNIIPQIMKGMGKGFSGIFRLIGYADPAIRNVAKGFATMMTNFDKWTKSKRAQKFVGEMVDSLKSVGKFGGSIIKFLGALFVGGGKAGNSLFDSMSASLDRWSKTIASKKGQKWMADTVRDTKDLASSLLGLADSFLKVVDTLRPLVGLLAQMSDSMGSDAMTALLAYGGYKVLTKGKGGAAGAGGAAAAGGAAGAGGTAAAGGAAGAAAKKGGKLGKVGGFLKGSALFGLGLGALETVRTGDSNKGLSTAYDALPTTFIAGLLGLDISSKKLGMTGSGASKKEQNSGLGRYSGSKGWGNIIGDIGGLFGGGGNKKVSKVAPNLAPDMSKIGASVKKAATSTIRDSTKAGRTIGDKLSAGSAKAKTNVTKNYSDMAASVKSGSATILADTNTLLKAFGATPVATNVVQAGGGSGGNGRTPSGNSRSPNAAKGARLPGPAIGDHIPLYSKGGGLLGIADGGELVVNRHTENRVNQKLAMYGTSLGREVAGESRPHTASPGKLPRYARGGRTGGPSGMYTATTFGGPGDPGTGSVGYKGDNLNAKPNSFAELNMGTALGGLPYMAPITVALRGKKMTLYKRDIGGGGPGLNGHTRAVDIWYQAAQQLGLNGLEDVMVNGAGGGAGSGERVKQPRVRGAGAGRNIAQGAMKKLTDQANKYIDRKRPKDVTVSAGAGGETSTTGLVPQVTRALGYAKSHGWGGVVNSGFRTRAEQEVLYARYLAGGTLAAKPGTSNHESGQAVDVSDPGSFGAAMRSAPANSRLIAGIPSEPWHYSVTGNAKGGRLPFAGWHKRGGSFTAHGPTMFGAGEAGSERVTITPKGRGNAAQNGAKGVAVHIHNIQWNKDGDVRQAIEQEFRNLRLDLATTSATSGDESVY